MTIKYIYGILITVFMSLLSGCYCGTLPPYSDSPLPTESSENDGELQVSVITPGGNNIAYRGEEIFIDLSPDKIPQEVSIILTDDTNQARVLVTDYPGPFPFSWLIPDDFPSGESYRVLINTSYYKTDSGYYGRSPEFAVLPASVSGLSDITVSSRIINITLTDNGSVVDGDTVSISLNGNILDENHVLTGPEGTTIPLSLQQGTNTLKITAVNEGAVHPNTAEISFSDVITGEAVQQWRLLEGETGTLIISAP